MHHRNILMSQQLQFFKSGSAFYDRRRTFCFSHNGNAIKLQIPLAIVVIYFLNITRPFSFKEIYNVTCSVLLGVTVNTNTTDCHLPKENGK